MVKRSGWMTVLLALVMLAILSTKADACGGCGVLRPYPYCGGYCGAGNCGLGWGACGNAWWFGYGGYGACGCGYGCRYSCAPRVHHHCWLFHRWHGCGGCGWGGCGSCGDGCSGGSCGAGCVGDKAAQSSSQSPGVVAETIVNEQTLPVEQGSPENLQLDRSARRQTSPFRLTSGGTKDGSSQFNKGLTEFRQGKPKEALGAFETAANAEPENALYHYYRAMAMFDVAGAEAAQDALQQAVELETRQPIKNWGRLMERVQGRSRVWVETARRGAGLVR
jgi:hypothetical protein